MASCTSAPVETALASILKDWEALKLDGITTESMITLCNTVWPTYWLGSGATWPVNGTPSFDDISELDLYCRSQQKWSEVPYVQAFMALYRQHHPKKRVGLYPAFATKKEDKQPVGMIDAPLLVSPQLPVSTCDSTRVAQKDAGSPSSPSKSNLMPTAPRPPPLTFPLCHARVAQLGLPGVKLPVNGDK